MNVIFVHLCTLVNSKTAGSLATCMINNYRLISAVARSLAGGEQGMDAAGLSLKLLYIVH